MFCFGRTACGTLALLLCSGRKVLQKTSGALAVVMLVTAVLWHMACSRFQSHFRCAILPGGCFALVDSLQCLLFLSFFE
jgi:hypothetical protein